METQAPSVTTTRQIATLEQMKQQARERDAARQERERQAELEQRARIERNTQALRDMLNRTAPYGEFFDRGVVTLDAAEIEPHKYDTQIVAHFALPGHAEMRARFVWEKNDEDIPGQWEHRGFLTNKGYEYSYWTDDPNKMWRVLEWTGTKYEPETETYYASYKEVDFADLGDALWHAERAYRDPADIQREVDDHNRAAAFISPTPPAAPAAEPTSMEILMDALKNVIDERVQIAQYPL